MSPHRFLLVLAFAAGASSAASAADATKMAATIDARLAVQWEKASIRPTAIADDPTFLRRVTLDLVGRIPTVAEAREFLSDTSANKRAKLIERLIGSGGHTRFMSTFWRRSWMPQADTPEFARLADDFEAWLALRLQDNVGYERMVHELLTMPLAADGRGRVRSGAGIGPASFFTAADYKPENLAANASRAFLGVNLDCAQCHDHPFARWTRDQFWQTAAFFAPPRMDAGGKMTLPELTVPKTTKSLAPELLTGTPVKWPDALASDTGRKMLAEWVTTKDNPYFARNAVNRLWAHHFGTALVEPLDDLSGESGNTGNHADLLKELAEAFTASGFDLKHITRAMTLTRAYQLSAVTRIGTPTDLKFFARMPVRGLTGEQLYDSLRAAAGLPQEREDTGRGQALDARRRFAARFHIERPVSAERSITQALSLMNGRTTTDLTDPAKNPTLASVIAAPFLDTHGKVETLFLVVLGRKPSAKESKHLVEYVQNGGTDNSPERALGDVFWALVNCTEFNTNH